MKRKQSVFVAAALVFSLSACSSPGSNGTGKKHTGEIIPTGIHIEQDDMNNYMRRLPEFAYDASSVYFDDMYYNYKFSLDTGELQRTPRGENNVSYDGLIVDGMLFTHLGYLYEMGDASKRWSFFIERESELDGELERAWPDSTVLPDGDYVYYLYRSVFGGGETIYRTPIKKIKTTEDTTSDDDSQSTYLDFHDSEVVFQQDGLSGFGIYGNHIIAETEFDDYWVIDLDTGENRMIINRDNIRLREGFDYVAGETSVAVNGEYIYFVNLADRRFERIKFDGTGHEIVLDGMFGAANGIFNIYRGDLYHAEWRNEDEKWYLYRTDLSNPSEHIVLASSSSWSIPWRDCAPIIIGDWIYYGNISVGYWRIKTDGSQTERITYAAYSADEPKWDAEQFEKHNIAAGSGHTVAIRSDGTVLAAGNNEDGQ